MQAYHEVAVPGRVIQGFFVGGSARALGIGQPAPRESAARRAGPPAPAFAGAGRRPDLPPRCSTVAQPKGSAGSFTIDPVQIGLVRGGGAPLPQAVLAKMEAAFGADFSGVRVHIGPQASRIGAVAFTMGDDLYFAPGRYQPDSVGGQQLIGHELAHVIQQRQGRVRANGSGVSIVQDHALEAEADRLGMRAAMHSAPVQAKSLPFGTRAAPVRSGRVQPVQRMIAQNQATESSQSTYLTAYNSSNGVQLCENLGSVGGAHSEDRLIDVILPAAAANGQLLAGADNVLYVGINRSPCTSTDHRGNGSPSCNKGGGVAGCAERLILLVTNGINHGGSNYPIRLVLEVRNLYGSNDDERANSAEAITAMTQTGRIECSTQRTATSTRFLNTGTAKQFI